MAQIEDERKTRMIVDTVCTTANDIIYLLVL